MRVDLLLGRAALDRGWITEAQLRETLAERRLSVARGRKFPRPVAAILTEQRLLSDLQAVELVREIDARVCAEEAGRRKDSFIGQILVDADLVAPAHVEAALQEQAERWRGGEAPLPRLGEILVQKGYAAPEDIEQALVLQKATTASCAACARECSLAEGDTCPACGGRLQARPDSTVIPAAVAPKPAPKASTDPAVIGRYKVVGVLGKGATGVVYDALDGELNRRIALKVLRADSPKTVDHLLREGRAAAKLVHPDIATVYEAGTADGRHYLAMQKIDGPTYAEAVRARSLNLRQKVRLLRDVALALQHAHEHGVLHRDLKPGNILLDRRGRPVVVDFGLAVMGDDRAPGILGTPQYMSPEQARGDRGIGPATDVWALGVMLYEALAGRPPFRGETSAATRAQVLCEAPPPFPAPGRAVLRPLETLSLRALEKKASARPSSARAFAEVLASWLKGDEAQASKRRTSPLLTRRAAVAAGVLLALAGIAAGVGLARADSRTEKTLKRAREYLNAGQPDGARQLYERILEREPGNAAAQAGRDAALARLEAITAREDLDALKAELGRMREAAPAPLAEAARRLEERVRSAEERARRLPTP